MSSLSANGKTPTILTITSENFKTEVLEGTTPILLDFWAPWCGPCRMLAPVLESLATKMAGEIRIGKVNVDEYPDLSGTFGVQGIPALFLVRGRQVVASVAGFLPVEKLEKMVRQGLESGK